MAVPVARFRAEPGGGQAPLAVQFVNESLYATESYWDFGDGIVSWEINPLHVYVAAQIYTAMLTVTSVDGVATASVTINADVPRPLDWPLWLMAVIPSIIFLTSRGQRSG